MVKKQHIIQVRKLLGHLYGLDNAHVLSMFRHDYGVV